MGITAVIVIFFHGSAWIIKKTNSPLNDRLRKAGAKWAWLIPAFVFITSVMLYFVRSDFYGNYFHHIYLYIFPIIGIAAAVWIPFSFKRENDSRPFLSTSTFIIFMLLSTLIGMYPIMLPSTNAVNPALDIYNSAASHYGLVIGLAWWIIAIILAIIYFTYVHKVFAGKITEESMQY
jgi:cytochrome d ubiquinol oxidase subunit II